MTATIIPIGEESAGWERALYAFLAEKEAKSETASLVAILAGNDWNGLAS